MILLYVWRYMIAVLIYDCRFDVKTDVLVSWKWIFMQKATHFCIFIQWVAFCFLYLISVNIITNYKQMPLFAYTFQSWYFSFEKAWVLGRESMGFAFRKHGFYDLKPMLLDRNLMPFWKRSPRPLKLYIYATLASRTMAPTSRTVVSVPRPPRLENEHR